jgi:hypothetical protein
MNAITIYQNNSGFIPLTGLQDFSVNPPVWVNNASSITATLNNAAGNPVAGLSNVAGVYQAGSNGNYNFPVPSSFNPPAGGGYTLVVNVTAPSGAVAQWSIPANVMVRGAAVYST